jgi:hypothetical protein
MMGKAILIPMDEEGGIPAREAKIRQQGANHWLLIAPGEWIADVFPHPEICKGFIYDISEKKVTHECDISWIKPMSEVPVEDVRKYGRGFENQEDYDELAEIFYVFNITAFRQLEKPLPLSAFRKYKDEQPVKLVRNYCIVQEPVKAEF